MNRNRLENVMLVILGTDINAYGIARSCHSHYEKTSHAFGYKALVETANSRIVTPHIVEGFYRDEVFTRTLLDFAAAHPDKEKVLVPCSDLYAELMSRNAEVLQGAYRFRIVEEALRRKLEDKIDFYHMCETYGLEYPDTHVLDAEYADFDFEGLEYPIAVKPNDSIGYAMIDFPHKKKAYTIHTPQAARTVMAQIYGAGYKGAMILQDFIPGDQNEMAVLNTYSDGEGRVRMMCYGKCLLDEVLPLNIGNYNALVTEDNPEVYDRYQKFLEAIGYKGYGNFDLKRDPRDGRFKVFEMNLRPGRSSFYMEAGGLNYISYLLNDVLDGGLEGCHRHTARGLWLYVDPYVLKKYASPGDRAYAKELLKDGYAFTQWYENDRSPARLLQYWRRRLSTVKYYRIYG